MVNFDQKEAPIPKVITDLRSLAHSVAEAAKAFSEYM
jgi:hypothetical protein